MHPNNGQNLLSGSNQIQASFDERDQSKLTIDGFNLNGPGVDTENGLFSVAAYASDGSFDLTAFGVTGDDFNSIDGDADA